MPTFPAPDSSEETVPADSLRDDINNQSVIDTSKVPIATLMPFVEGYSWTTEYYSQILGDNDDPEPLSLELDPTIQQYHRVSSYELKVSDPLAFEFVTEIGTDAFSGSAIIYPNTIVPNLGDMFLADIGDGTLGVFTLNNVTPTMFGKDKCYQVSYYLMAYQEQGLTDNLTLKTIQTSYFIKDYLIAGNNPMLNSAELGEKTKLEGLGRELFSSFKSKFISRTHRYLLVPDQEKISYDPFVSKMLRSLVEVSQHKDLSKLNWPSLDSVSAMKVNTLWDSILTLTPIGTDSISKKMQLVDTWFFKNMPIFGNIFYTPLKLIVYPLDNTYDVDDGYNLDDSPDGYDIITGSAGSELDVVVDDGDPTTPDAIVYPVTKDDYYVLSQAFYDGDRVNQSLLELVITKVISKESIDNQDVIKLCEEASKWGTLEQYYYIPLLLMSINYVLRIS